MFLAIPLLTGLSYFIGFEETSYFPDDVIDAFVAYTVGFVTSGVMLYLFGVLNFVEDSPDVTIGKIAIQAVIAAIGAMLAQSQLGASGDEEEKEKESGSKKKRRTKYGGELFLMAVGALFLAMSPAPTEEIILISYKMSVLHFISLVLLSIILMHAFVYKVEFRGQESRKPAESSAWSVFLRYTVVGYALVLLISLYLIWTFGHTEGMSAENIVKAVVVMGFPAALGAAASRLIL